MTKYEKESSGKIMQLLTEHWITHPLYIVTKLGIPDILSEEPKLIEDIARITKSYTPFLYRILRALASLGFFHEDENRVFSVTPMGEMLQKDKMQPIVLMFLSGWHNKAWEYLFHGVLTGDIPFDSAFGISCFEWFKENSEAAEIFHRANKIKATTGHTEITNVYDFSNVNSIVDVGGGYGGLLFYVLQRDSHLKGWIADLSHMKEEVEKEITSHNLGSRCMFIECDFFQHVPNGSDCYVLSNILHDWDDDNCVILLNNCRDAMSSTSRLLIIESIIPGRNEFSIANLLDIEVLVMGGGKERTESEYRELLDRSGFYLNRVIETKESISLLECTKD